MALATAVLERITTALGADAVQDGVVTARSSDDVVALCRICTETRTPIRIHSGLAAPNPDGVALSVRPLQEVRVDAARFVVHAGAGATVDSVTQAVTRAGLALAVPFPPVEGVAHVGTVVARGLVPRRACTGIAAVLPTGARVAAQGAVLRDVTGYDLTGVLLGSRGTLAVITAVYFRLVPGGVTVPASPAPEDRAAGPGSDRIRAAFDPDGLLTPAGR